MANRRFQVKGRYPFPLDMLRYDCCWPAETEDVGKLDDLIDGVDLDPSRTRYITLGTAKPRAPTVERWQSFGWDVDWKQ